MGLEVIPKTFLVIWVRPLYTNGYPSRFSPTWPSKSGLAPPMSSEASDLHLLSCGAGARLLLVFSSLLVPDTNLELLVPLVTQAAARLSD